MSILYIKQLNGNLLFMKNISATDGYHTFALHHFVRALDKYADTYLSAEHGISYSRFLCLVAIHAKKETTQHDIAEWLQVGDAVVSRVLRPLEKQKFVVIREDPGHGLKKKVSLTPKGEKLVLAAASDLEKQYQELAKISKINALEVHDAILRMHRVLTDE